MLIFSHKQTAGFSLARKTSGWAAPAKAAQAAAIHLQRHTFARVFA
jgi:hypothetical protein